MLVVMGPIVGVSVVKLYAAAIIPGLMLVTLYLGYALVRSYLNPQIGPAVPLEDRLVSKKELIREFLAGIVPISVIIFAALGSIIMGIATATEAAAMAAGGSIVLTLLFRRLNWKALKESLLNTLQTSSMVMFLAVASTIFCSRSCRRLIWTLCGSPPWLR
jgi:TRAP-type mannitol/chloroaromatic compound transport system permease large subunit